MNNVQEKINALIVKYHDTGQYPTDRELLKIGIEWTNRDWPKIDMEGIGFQRGLQTVMILMRNIIEYNEKLYKELQ